MIVDKKECEVFDLVLSVMGFTADHGIAIVLVHLLGHHIHELALFLFALACEQHLRSLVLGYFLDPCVRLDLGFVSTKHLFKHT